MKAVNYFAGLVLSTLLLSAASIAQGPPGHDPDNAPPGHGGVPPGQAKKYDRGGGMPPGQAKKYGGNPDFHFQNDDRGRFYSHYRSDASRWGNRKRPYFAAGQPYPVGYAIRPVPRSYWAGASAPPPGYQYGYYGGYVVAYNPTTRIVVDVLDLVGAATSR